MTPEALDYLQVRASSGQRRGDDRPRRRHHRGGRLWPEVAVGRDWHRLQLWRRVPQGIASNFQPDLEFQTGDLAGNGGPTPPVNGHSTFASSSPRRRSLSSNTTSSISCSSARAIAIQATRSRITRSAPHVQDRGRVRTDPGHPLPRQLQPRGSRSEHRRAVLPRSRWAGRNKRSCAPGAGGLPCCDSCTMPADRCHGGPIRHRSPRNPANQYNGLLGGNPNLSPEKADSLTAGVILQPRFIPGLALTADYFNIKVKNVIGARSLRLCSSLHASPDDPPQCAFIHRDQFGTLVGDEQRVRRPDESAISRASASRPKDGTSAALTRAGLAASEPLTRALSARCRANGNARRRRYRAVQPGRLSDHQVAP